MFMVGGNMACGIVRDDLMVRVGPERHEAALAEPHTRPMDFAGRPMKGMVYVAPEGCKTAAALARWVGASVDYAVTLPSKPAKKAVAKKAAPAKKAALAKEAPAKRAPAKKAVAKKAPAKKKS